MEEKIKLGFAMCGSFCTLNEVVCTLCSLTEKYDIMPIMSGITYETDTRFGTAQSFKDRITKATGKDIIHTVAQAEPIGPKKLLDVMVIAPCTGNTLAKLTGGITDTSVTMAAKAHLRNGRPLIIALSTNDALSGSAKNIGALMNYKNVYFVPFSQDNPHNKERSCIADMNLIDDTIKSALKGVQFQPMIK